ncbi:alpha/beta fold hydrolase [Paenibacillus hodogayensis]|uniref:Alpha/beta fold hydrolase n=1 Tax=Paenibacillus hodogayensis TaxID=279208 RepID=A0ABV5VU75_9BACL
MTYVKTDLFDIPCLRMKPTGTSKGTVLLYHGWSSSIESYEFFASTITHWGYEAVVPELPHHGERGKLNYGEPGQLQQYFWPTVLQGLEEAKAIAFHLAGQDARLAVIGHSMGGFIAGGVSAKVPAIRSAVVINGSCAWVKFEELYRSRLGLPASDEAQTALGEHDPITAWSAGNDTALLLLHGTEDTTVPIDSQSYFASAAPKERFRALEFVQYSGVNHQITLSMLQRTKGWLDDYLAGR